MEKISQKDIDWLLNPSQKFQMGETIQEEVVKKRSFKSRVFKILFASFMVVGLGIIPFFVLIRTAVYLNLVQDWNGWASLLGGMGASITLLIIYVLALFRKVKSKKLLFQFGLGGVSVLVGGFCIYGLLYLSSVNAKSDSVREVYNSLHPILRVAVATTTLAENSLVITDIKRTPEDYAKMGLSPRQSSFHYPQESGFVHAIDLRTIGHSQFRNKTLELSLEAMGFQTIRHVGTADHLHIALPISN